MASIGQLLKPSTANAAWAHLYANQITLGSGEIVSGLVAWVNKNGDQTVLAADSDQIINWNIVFDPNSLFASNAFTVDSDGIYRLDYILTTSEVGASPNGTRSVVIQVNAIDTAVRNYSAATTGALVNDYVGYAYLELSAGDDITLLVANGTGNAVVVADEGGADQSSMTLTKIVNT